MANLTTELAKFYGSKVQRMFLGICKPCEKKNAIKVEVNHYKLNEYILWYYNDKETYFAWDPQKLCKSGDIVLIKELEKKKTLTITHEILKIIFPCGDIIDPVTKRKVTKNKFNKLVYRDDLDKLHEVFGKLPTRFDYDKAPPRGWQEGKRDFTDKEMTVHFNDDNVYDPYEYDV